jgi:pyridoxal/pyridoxine/pyridoxamine kinase
MLVGASGLILILTSDEMTGYGAFEGSIVPADELQEIFRGLEANGLLKPARLLTGMLVSKPL